MVNLMQPSVGTSESSTLGPILCYLTLTIHRITLLAAMTFFSLRDDVAKAFVDGKRYFKKNSDITASQLYAYAVSLAERYGWEFGGPDRRAPARPPLDQKLIKSFEASDSRRETTMAVSIDRQLLA